MHVKEVVRISLLVLLYNQLLIASVLRNEIQEVLGIVCHSSFCARIESSDAGFLSILLAVYERSTQTTTRRFDRNAERRITLTL